MIYERISGFSDEISENIHEQFAVLNKLGIGYFEPRGVNGKSIARLTPEEVQELKTVMERRGIRASSVGSPIGKIRLSEDFEPHFAMFRNVVDIAKQLGTKYIRVFSFYHDGGDWSEAERQEIFSRLRRMIRFARENDVILLHENEKDIYGDTAQHCLDLMQHLSCEHFQAVFDFANFVQCGVDTREAYHALKAYIRYVHIKDAKQADGHVVPIGLGDGNAAYILADLFQSGYQGFLSLEPHLGSFQGLAELETGVCMEDLPKGGEGTFTLAHTMLLKLLERM